MNFERTAFVIYLVAQVMLMLAYIISFVAGDYDQALCHMGFIILLEIMRERS